MSSAICFKLDMSKILSSGNGLTLYQMTKVYKSPGSYEHENLQQMPS